MKPSVVESDVMRTRKQQMRPVPDAEVVSHEVTEPRAHPKRYSNYGYSDFYYQLV